MAQKVVLIDDIDDIDGSEAAETLTFSYRGTQYEVDLSQEHIDELEKALVPIIKVARQVQTTPPPRRRRAAAEGRRTPPVSTQEIRKWAREQGLEISDRGRIPAEIAERYEREIGPTAS
jgi:hypothetical protein